MNPDLFFENFELLADAPNGIQKLRELILQLAVMGKLVEQDPSDEPASVLIEKIKSGKESDVKGKRTKKSESLLQLDAEEIPFKPPIGWKWCYLDDISVKITDGEHLTPERTSSGHYLLSARNVQNGKISLDDVDYVPEKEFLRLRKRCDPNKDDILISCSGSVGRVAVVDKDDAYVMVRSAALIKPYLNFINSKYLAYTIRSPVVQNQIVEESRTTAQSNLFLGKIKNLKVILPPLNEQKRIVAKIDELMILCDKLEAHRQKKQELQSKLNSAALDRMLSAENQEEFEQNWQRICENFDLLYDNPENVEKLRQAILQLAVQGKLVPRDPEDEPASILIEKVEAERKISAKQGETRKNRSLNAKEISEISCELPRGWEWVRFSDIGEFGRGKSKHRPRNDPILFNNGKYPLVQTGDVAKANGTIGTYTNLYNEVGLAQSRMWPKGTLCITIAANIADSAILGFDACFPDSVVGFIPSSEIGSTRYFEYFMRTMKENLEHFAPSTAQKNINLGILENVLIPLPPKKELKRIIEKTDQLMGLCDELEAKLRKEREESQKLVETVVKGLLESAVAGRSESDKLTLVQAAVIQSK